MKMILKWAWSQITALRLRSRQETKMTWLSQANQMIFNMFSMTTISKKLSFKLYSPMTFERFDELLQYKRFFNRLLPDLGEHNIMMKMLDLDHVCLFARLGSEVRLFDKKIIIDLWRLRFHSTLRCKWKRPRRVYWITLPWCWLELSKQCNQNFLKWFRALDQDCS